ncbi:MAG: hypothetical protein AAFX76_10710, partial [Planctomycetota bacterium]
MLVYDGFRELLTAINLFRFCRFFPNKTENLSCQLCCENYSFSIRSSVDAVVVSWMNSNSQV